MSVGAGMLLLTLLVGCRNPGPPSITAAPDPLSGQPGWVASGFLFDEAPFPSSHASTMVDTKQGILAAWFGGPHERHPEVVIWTSRYEGAKWSPPVQVADGLQADGKTRHPCWNPVLFLPDSGPLLLFYKVGPSPENWWGMLMTSADNGRTWSPPRRLPDGQVGPVRNKPIAWAGGSLLCGSSTEDQGWRVHMEWTPDAGRTWERTGPLNDGRTLGLIQPTLLRWPSGRTQILCRSRQGRVYESWMGESWRIWKPLTATPLPNPNSAIDAVVLKDGRALLVYNHTAKDRSPLNVAVSREGLPWQAAAVLEQEPGEYSYPAVIQSRDGRVHITYTWKRQRIKHVVLDPAKLQPRDLVDGRWPD